MSVAGATARVAGAALLWLVASAAIVVVQIAAFYLFLKVRAPNDPTVGDSVVWSLVLGAPVYLFIAGPIGMVLAAVLWRLFTKLVARGERA